MIQLLYIIQKIKTLYEHLCADVMKKYKLTRSELDILLFLRNNPRYDTAKDIVEKRGLTKSHASMGIEKLIKKGLLDAIQDSQDKRKYHLVLLDDSKPIIKDGLKVQRKFGKIIYKDFTDDELKQWKKYFKKMHINILEMEDK